MDYKKLKNEDEYADDIVRYRRTYLRNNSRDDDKRSDNSFLPFKARNSNYSNYNNEKYLTRRFDETFKYKTRTNSNYLLPRDLSLEASLFTKLPTSINFGYYNEIPVKCTGEDIPSKIDSFNECSFHEIILNNIGLCGYEKPTPVQQYSIPIMLAQRDLMACAQTGSGKTASFLIPILEILYKMAIPVKNYVYIDNIKRWLPFALVLSPTRELAIQIYEEAQKLTYRSNIKPFLIYGGVDIRSQIRSLDYNQGCHLIISTPGRLIDLYDRNKISFENVQFLVIDEADKMLDMGFEPQIREIIENKNMPLSNERLTVMFSATFPKQIQRLARDFLKRNYIQVAIGQIGSTSINIKQNVIWMNECEKYTYLLDVLNICSNDDLKLIFVETKRTADQLEEWLVNDHYSAISIHGDKNQYAREYALNEFRQLKKKILIATSVAARGLDISNVKYVINYDLPNDINEYVHRIGRTGRAGAYGEAISFFTEKNFNIAHDLYNLLDESRQEIPEFLKRGSKAYQYRHDRILSTQSRQQSTAYRHRDWFDE